MATNQTTNRKPTHDVLHVRGEGKSAYWTKIGAAWTHEDQGVEIVQPLDEKQIRDLLDHRERVGDAARPEGVPDLVDLIAQFPRQHGLLIPTVFLARHDLP